MEAVHAAGLRSNATMLYGHVETLESRVDHMRRLRELQDRTGGFQSFIPLAFHPKNTEIAKGYTTGLEDLLALAVARLYLDNFRHIKSFWIMVGPKLAQISLHFGVDDIDGTVVEEKITHAAGAQAGQEMSVAELVTMIRQAGKIPVERDTLYNVVREWPAEGPRGVNGSGADWREAVERASRGSVHGRGGGPAAAGGAAVRARAGGRRGPAEAAPGRRRHLHRRPEHQLHERLLLRLLLLRLLPEEGRPRRLRPLGGGALREDRGHDRGGRGPRAAAGGAAPRLGDRRGGPAGPRGEAAPDPAARILPAGSVALRASVGDDDRGGDRAP